MKIGIFGKGGAGKSTCTVLLARALGRRGHKVVVLDADSTNRGLHRALGIGLSPRPLVEYFGGTVFRGGRVSCPVDDPTPLSGSVLSLGELPAAYKTDSVEGITYLMAGKLGDEGPGAGCDGPLAKIVRDISIESGAGGLVTLVDLKAGFEDSARGVITGLDAMVVVVDPTTASIGLARDMADLVEAIRRREPPATAHLESPELVRIARDLYDRARVRDVFVLLNRVGSAQVEETLRRRLAEFRIDVTGVVRDQSAIGEAWLNGAPLPSESVPEGVVTLAESLEGVLHYA